MTRELTRGEEQYLIDRLARSGKIRSRHISRGETQDLINRGELNPDDLSRAAEDERPIYTRDTKDDVRNTEEFKIRNTKEFKKEYAKNLKKELTKEMGGEYPQGYVPCPESGFWSYYTPQWERDARQRALQRTVDKTDPGYKVDPDYKIYKIDSD